MKMRIAISFVAAGTVLLAHHAAHAQEVSDKQKAHIIHRQAYHYHIAESYDEALHLYKQSAEMGLAKSENAIGRILAFDRKGKRNYVAALPWFIRAEAPRQKSQGYGFIESQRQAKNFLDWYCRKGPAEFPDSHAFSKDPKCWQGRGEALMSGKFKVKKDYAKAQAILEKAVAAGRLEAEDSLAKAKVLNVPQPPRDYGKIAGGVAGALLFVVMMRFLRWRQRLYWIIHKLHP